MTRPPPRPAITTLLTLTLTAANAQGFSSTPGELSNLGAVFSQSLGSAAPATAPLAPPVAPAPVTVHSPVPTPAQASALPVTPVPSTVVPVVGTGAPLAAAPITVPAYAVQLAQLRSSNPFDPQRRLWPDRVPPPPPPAPPPAPTPITEQDMQLYGVTIVGSQRLATVKIGGRFAQMAPAARPFVTLGEGQTVGEFTVSHISPDRLVLQAVGGQQVLYFTKKSDRNGTAVASAAPPPVQAATEPPAPPPASGSAAVGLAAGASTPTTAPAASGAEPPAAGANPAPAVSLIEALAAARARAAQNTAPGNDTPANPAPGNPFNPSAAGR